MRQARWTANLRPGEALYIPALWFHHVVTGAPEKTTRDGARDGMSVAVNVFFNDDALTPRAYDVKDIFGNKVRIVGDRCDAMRCVNVNGNVNVRAR